MSNSTRVVISAENNWHFAAQLHELQDNNVLMVRLDGKQIALFDTPAGIRACDNRCPHEGYPLSEGSISGDCTLTCNWHNWKFSLEDGENLYGGDRLRTYPIDLRDGEIWLELSDPPYAEQYATIKRSLHDAFVDHSYDRIAREVARLIKLGGNPLDALRHSISWSWQQLEFGWTHAYAGMADWLMVYEENPDDPELQLVCLVESIAHVAFDVLREAEYPYPDATAAYDETAFLQAVEQEDQAAAIAMLRGGLNDGLQFTDFERGLSHAALAHYNDFGHSLIYVTKVGYLIEKLGPEVAEPLLLSLVRGIIFASREDKIPEFRAYQSTLEAWQQQSKFEKNASEKKVSGKNGCAKNAPEANEFALPVAEQWHKLGIEAALQLTLSQREVPPLPLYQALLEANAINQLSFNLAQQDKTHVSVSGNVSWLDFTHGLTFANAVRQQCTRYPELWPQGLLQMACFSGRNASFTLADYSVDDWCGDDPEAEMAALLPRVFDHGQGEYIISVHWLKTALAVREEMAGLPPEKARILVAALKRFIESPLKRRQTRRTAYQSLKFVAKG